MQTGYDANGEYTNDIDGAVQAAIDFLEAKQLTADRTLLASLLQGQDMSKPAFQLGRFVAGIAIRNSQTMEVNNK